MTGRRAIIGLCMLSALVFSAIAAQSATAVETGTTAFTCVKVTKAVGTAGFSKEHCKPGNAVSSNAEWEHKKFKPNTTTKITGSNETTNGEKEVSRLKAVITGIETELQSTVLEGSGTMVNNAEGEEMWAEGEGTITYKNVTVAKSAAKAAKSGKTSTRRRWAR